MENASEQERQKAILRKYLAGKCSPQETEQVEEWYQSMDVNPLPSSEQESVSVGRAKKHVRQMLGHRPFVHTLVHILKPYTRIAALILLGFGVSWILYRGFFVSDLIDQKFVTHSGEQKTIILPDSSLVILNANSELRIIFSVSKKRRYVTLVGEAHFKVRKNPESPFRVQTGHLTTHVLGTTFNVQAYPNEESVAVTVSEGRVGVSEKKGSSKARALTTSLSPDMQLLFNKKTGETGITHVDAERVAAWRNGIIYFENASIPEIAGELERKYKLHISQEGESRADCRYTFTLNNEPVEKALEVLQKVSGITLTVKQSNHYTINTALCK